MKSPTIFDHAIFAHAKWKRHLREAIETGKSEWTVAEVKANDHCELGNWLKQLPNDKKISERYSHLCSLHADFHDAASTVLALALSGKIKDAQDEIAAGSHFSKISTKLTLTLSQWAKSEIAHG